MSMVAIIGLQNCPQQIAVPKFSTHHTRTSMLITIIAYWAVGLPLGYILSLTEVFGAARDVFGIWIGLVAGLAVAALLLNWRLQLINRYKIS